MTNKWGELPSAAPDSTLSPDAPVWFDGTLVPSSDARIGILTHTLHYGFGLFEGIRAYRQQDGTSAVFRLRAHVDRMFDGARILHLGLPFTPEQLCDACVQTLRANGLAEAYVRPIAFVGEGKMGIYAPRNRIHVAVAAWPWGAYLGDEGATKGIRAKVSSFTRATVNAAMVRAKVTGAYVTSILAKSEAAADGYDEAILLDQDGYCAEGSGENLFMVRDGTLVTPPLSSPILAGITRDTLLTLARELSIPVLEQRFTRDDLYLCQEAFFTGTAAEVTPIREVDGRPIGDGRPGPVSRRLMQAFDAAIRGEDDGHHDWRTLYECPA